LAATGVEAAFRMLEGRWKMVIIFHLFDRDVLRFSELEPAIPGVSQKMLIQQLRDLNATASSSGWSIRRCRRRWNTG
jgi:DNA-binding HxlR family transcriptional regulator